MRFRTVTVLLPACLYLMPAARPAETSQVPTVQLTPEQTSQRATDNDSDPRDNRKTPLTPEEEMQNQIRLFDPLDGAASRQPGARNQNQNQNQSPNPDQTRNPASRQPGYSTPLNQPLNSRDPLGNATDGDDTLGPETPDPPLPGSIEEARQANQAPGFGPRVEEDAGGAQNSEYTGPAVLTRAYSINTLPLPTDLKFHESLSFSEMWDSGTSISGPNSPNPAGGGSAAASISWSVSGQHLLNKTDMLGFAYSGSMSAYSTAGNFNGSNHLVTVHYSHLISRRLALNVGTTGSIFSANYAVQNPIASPGTSIANVDLASSPTLQPYSSGSKQFSSTVGLNWQRSARMSFNFSGGYFASAQDGLGLIGVMGMQAQGGVNYRYSRRATIGLYYSFSHNAYSHGFGSSDSNSGGLSYALALTRSTHISMRAGLARSEAIAESPVVVAPIVFEIFGSPLAIVDQYNRRTTGDFSIQLARDLGRNMAGSLAFVHGMSPGNGQLLTSTQQVFSANWSMRLRRTYTLQFTGMSESLSSVAQTLSQTYHMDVAQFSIGHRYRGGITANFSASYSYFGHSTPFQLPYEIHLSSGISWSPPSLKMWPF